MEQKPSFDEAVLSRHLDIYWKRRMQERHDWVQHPKPQRAAKVVRRYGESEVDEELYPAILLLNQADIRTEYSCAGVSVLDEPEEHSLYAYVTLTKTPLSADYVHYLMNRMRHRLLVTYEPARQRFDLSSFFICHNRSFCLFLYHYTKRWIQGQGSLSSPDSIAVLLDSSDCSSS